MNPQIRSAFVNATLSEATYSNGLTTGMTGSVLAEALELELSRPFADLVGERFSVVRQTLDTSSGFAVTVFRDTSSAQRYIAFRGTEELPGGIQDWVADIDLAIGSGLAYRQVIAMVNWYMRASIPTSAQATQLADTWHYEAGQLVLDTYLAAGTGELAGSPDWIVTGHSLGGHLATAFARLFGNSGTQSFTFNGAGFLDSANSVFGIIERSLGIGATSYPGLSRQKNFFAEHGVNVATNDWWLSQFGERIALFNEEGFGVANHRIYKLADALALCDVMGGIDSGLTLANACRILNAGANSAPASLETVLDSLRRLYRVADLTPTLVGDAGQNTANREDYHSKMATLRGVVEAQSGTTIAPLVDMSTFELTTRVQAANGLAYRYALRNLNPFAVLGADSLYTPHNANGDLDLYDAAAGVRRGMTNQYITDRASFLSAKNAANIADGTSVYVASEPDNWTYVDLSQSYQVTAFGAAPAAIRRRAIFDGYGAGVLTGQLWADRLYGGSGNNILEGKASDDYLEGGAGLDIYQYNASGASTHDGADTILDTDGRGVLRYVHRQGTLFTTTTTTVITDASVKLSDTEWSSADGKFAYSLVPGDAGQSHLIITIGGNADSRITLKDFRDGDFGITLNQPAQRSFADPTGTILGTGASESLPGTPASDLVLAYAGGDTVRAAAGDDSVEGGDGADALYGEDGGDRLYGEAGRDSLYGGGGSDELHGGADADIVEGGDGADLLAGGAGSDVVVGDGGDDEVHAGDRAPLATALLLAETEAPVAGRGEWVDGAEGDDTVVAGPGNDQVMGGGGADLLVGGAGDDNLIGDASRTLVHIDNWLVTRQIITSGNATTYQLVYNGDAQMAESAAGADDVIYGGAGIDWVFAGAGSDFVDSGSGNDVVFGEAGADALTGGTGNDVLIGDNPGVVVEAAEDGDYLDGGEGDDQLWGNGGDDVLVGGAGRDTLIGGAGKDRYLLEKGGGEDTIVDVASTADDPEASVLVLGEGIARDAVKFRTGSFLVDLGDGDRVHLEGFDQLDPASTPMFGAIHFADGTSMNYAEVLAQGFDIDGTEEDDDAHDSAHPQLVGTGVTDRIRGLGGNDQLFGFAGNDVLAGGGGDDMLIGGEGDDAYLFSRGDGRDLAFEQDATPGNADRVEFAADIGPLDVDATHDATYPGNLVLTIRGSSDALTIANQFVGPDYQVEQIRFADGTAWIPATTPMLARGSAGADFIPGTSGPDVLEGLTGNDTLSGGAGNDLYRFARGDGQDVITDIDSTPGNVDAILYASDIPPSEIQTARSENNLVLRRTGSSDQITVTNYFANDGATPYSIESIRFLADGTAWEVDALKQRVLAATSGPDTLIGYASDDSIDAAAGNDTIEGAAGNDTLHGGTGDDFVVGGLGDDTFRFNLGDGRDIFSDRYGTVGFPGGGTDTLLLGAGITPANVTATKAVNGELNLQVNGTSDLARLSQYFGDDALERIQFGDGTVWTPATVAAMFPVNGTAGNDTLTGTGLPDTIGALAGYDLVYGGGGNDTIDGGLGSDTIYGEAGDDLIYGGQFDTSRKASSDVLYGGAGNDTLIVGSATGQVLYGESGNDIYVAGSGSAWMEDTGGNNVFLGSTSNDNIYMGDGNDLVIGGRGADSFDADRDKDTVLGRDVLSFNKGDGQDNVWGLGNAATVSIGGGALYSNLSLEVFSETLTLKVATSSITFQSWYGGPPSGPVRAKYLQMVIEGTKNYAPSSSDPLRNRKIQFFDFEALVAAFDTARALGQNFSVADNLVRFRLWSSDTAAMGGALAYQYARTGSLGTLSYAQMRSVVDDPAFGSLAQPIAAPAGAAATAEGAAPEGSGVVTAPTMVAETTGSSEPADALRSDATVAEPGPTWSAAPITDPPQAWFAPRAPQENARTVAAWQRIARDLPAHLERDAPWDGPAPFSSGVRVSPADAFGVRVTFDNSVGLGDAAAARLRPFEGLKEGFALLS